MPTGDTLPCCAVVTVAGEVSASATTLGGGDSADIEPKRNNHDVGAARRLPLIWGVLLGVLWAFNVLKARSGLLTF